MTATLTQPTKLGDLLTDRAMICEVHFSRWSASKEDKSASQEVADNHNSSIQMGQYRKQLLPPGSLKKIKDLDTKLRTLWYSYTSPWADGQRIMMSPAFLPFGDKARPILDERERAVDELVAAYTNLRDEAKKMLNGLWKAEDYPDVSVIRDKFDIKIHFLPVPTSNHLLANLGIENELDNLVKDRVDYAMKDVHNRVVSQVTHMLEKVKKYDPENKQQSFFRDSLVENMKQLAELLPALNVTGNQELDEVAQKIKEELCFYTAEELRASDKIRNITAASAEAILKQMEAFI